MSDDRTLAIARFGVEAEVFAASPIGVYLAEQCEAKARLAFDKLATVPPDNAAEIRRLQNEIATARSTMEWILGAIQRGHAALKTLDAREATD